jgi:hypothetical protein
MNHRYVKNKNYAQVSEVLDALTLGKSRISIARELGFEHTDDLDMFMKRNHYDWYPSRENYFINKEERPDNLVDIILKDLESGEDVRTISNKLHFKTTRQMTQYLKDHGYIWCEQSQKYKATQDTPYTKPMTPVMDHSSMLLKQLEDNLPLLALLNQNKSRLEELLLSKDP